MIGFFRADLRTMFCWLALLVMLWPWGAQAHFSYSDPRIIHLAEDDTGGTVVLMRLPAPLALLPSDWQGNEESRSPPFARIVDGVPMLDPAALDRSRADLEAVLEQSIQLSVDGVMARPVVQAVRLWDDRDRPRFGTLKTALSAMQADAPQGLIPYFDATLDVRFALSQTRLSGDLQLLSQQGARFQIMEKFGTVVKLHRAGAPQTRASLGVLDMAFPAVASRLETLAGAALSGAEHIYRGLDHLALILLIALAANGWRPALGWASAFTLGHIVTLAAGLYGFAPQAGWFVPLVEFGIALSIVAAGVAVSVRAGNAFGWISLFIVGLIHGYGFAASAATAQFAGGFDPLVLLAFAAGLEVCQFAIYALILPVMLAVDRMVPVAVFTWRRGAALGIAVGAVSATALRLSAVSGAFAAI